MIKQKSYYTNIEIDLILDTPHRPIKPNGALTINYRPGPKFTYGLDTFTGTIINRENIGKTAEELADLWSQDHPEGAVAIRIDRLYKQETRKPVPAGGRLLGKALTP